MSRVRHALIVIDMLLDFFERSSSLESQRAALVAHINELSRAFREHGQPVIWIRQEFRPDLQDAFLEMRRRDIAITIAGTCVRTTAIDAYQRDFDVIVAADCVGSYDREHHIVSVNYLNGKIARFLGNQSIAALLP